MKKKREFFTTEERLMLNVGGLVLLRSNVIQQPTTKQSEIIVLNNNNVYHTCMCRSTHSQWTTKCETNFKDSLIKKKAKSVSSLGSSGPMDCEQTLKTIIKTYHNNHDLWLSESQTTLEAMAQLSCFNHIRFMHFVHFCFSVGFVIVSVVFFSQRI